MPTAAKRERDERDEELDGQRAASSEDVHELVLGTEHVRRGGLVGMRDEMERARERAQGSRYVVAASAWHLRPG